MTGPWNSERLKAAERIAEKCLHSSDSVVCERTARKHELARALLRVLHDARVLVHAYESDNRPPADIIERYRSTP